MKVATLFLICSPLSCASTLDTPAATPAQNGEMIEVLFPPPPARAEHVPPKPANGALWIDGEWTWRGSDWGWERGKWVLPPPGATYSYWALSRDRFGTLLFAPGAWHDAKGNILPEPPALGRGGATSESVVDPEGTTEETSPTKPAGDNKPGGGGQ